MRLNDFLDDIIFGPLNYINRAERWLRGIGYKDNGYKMSIRRGDKGGRFTVDSVKAILREYGVSVYSITHDSQHMYFCVKRRQARWAEYLLLHAGVELTSPLFDERNPGYVANHPQGWMPKPWSEK